MIGYHFTGPTLRDGRPIPAIGEKLTHEGEIEWCRSGLYFSPTPWSALDYTPGNLLHRVEVARVERQDEDKGVCRERTILATIDAEYLLRRFGADQALSVAHLWDMPAVVKDYLTTLDKSKRVAAEAAARATTGSAARVVARVATRVAAWDAARDAAWGATRVAAEAAARAATGAAARAAMGAAARAAAEVAARDVAGSAAWVVARDAARDDFNGRVYAAFAALSSERLKEKDK